MILAGALGVLTGIVGFSPLMLAKYLSKRGSQAVRQQSIPIGVLLVLVSLGLLFGILVIASRIASEVFLVFGLSMVAAFLMASAILAVREFRKLL
jgi:uncharacterized membrane protein